MQPTIVSAADENYAAHFAALLHSAWTHHRDAKLYLLDCGLDPVTALMLRNYASQHGIRLTILKVDTDSFDGLPTTRDWSPAIYARLLIPDLLPDAERALYIDADCIVVGNLSAAWRLDMGDAAVVGIRDRGAHNERVFRLPTESYINSGVLLMNLPIWRQQRLGAAVLSFLCDIKPTFPDQTAINAIIDRKMFLTEGWNFLVGDKERPIGQWDTPRIIHFTGPMKPWLYRDAPFGELYVYHRNQTPFPILSPRTVSRSFLRRLVNLGLGRPKYWRRMILMRRCRAFVDRYFSRGNNVTFLRDWP
jgi:lipopolysaccharide biosynthesis glycosyltransferase